jgi:hypothetical protein
MEFLIASTGGIQEPESRTVIWKFGQVPAGTKRVVSIKTVARTAGTWLLPLVVQADGVDAVRGLATVQVEPSSLEINKSTTATPQRTELAPILALEITASSQSVTIGADTVYEIRVVNKSHKSCSNIRLLALVPEGLTPIAAEGPNSPPVQRQQIVFGPVPSLAPQATLNYRVQARGHRIGEWRFKAQVSCDQLLVPSHGEQKTVVSPDYAQKGMSQSGTGP